MITTENFTRVKNDINGNPRYVCHFLQLNTPEELNAVPWIDTSEKYNLALTRARNLGGRKFHNKQYGGGIVFRCVFNLRELCEQINELTEGVTV
jgi:hypothetical protein